MKFAFSTNAYLRFPFDEACARIAALGYDGLELMADVPHAWPAHLPLATKSAIRASMKKKWPDVFKRQCLYDECH